MKLKSDVNPEGVRPEIILAVIVAAGIWQKFGQDLVITSLLDGTHKQGSLHYSGRAVDLRTHYFSDSTKSKVASQLRDALTSAYQVVVEPTHIHVEFDPPAPGTP